MRIVNVPYHAYQMLSKLPPERLNELFKYLRPIGKWGSTDFKNDGLNLYLEATGAITAEQVLDMGTLWNNAMVALETICGVENVFFGDAWFTSRMDGIVLIRKFPSRPSSITLKALVGELYPDNEQFCYMFNTDGDEYKSLMTELEGKSKAEVLNWFTDNILDAPSDPQSRLSSSYHYWYKEASRIPHHHPVVKSFEGGELVVAIEPD